MFYPMKYSRILTQYDKDECWHCGKKAPRLDRGYTISESRTQDVHVEFCSNQECHSLYKLIDSIYRNDLVKATIRARASWNDKQAYLKMPKQLQNAYTEACKSFVNKCYLAVALICRTIIAYVAIDRGAEPGRKFENYVEYLVEENLLSSLAEAPLNQLRQSAGRAAHQLVDITEMNALVFLSNLDAMLKIIYVEPDIESIRDAT